MYLIILLLAFILLLLISGAGVGNRSPRSKLIGFLLEGTNTDDSSRDACEPSTVIKPNPLAEPSVFMYAYEQELDFSIFFKKYQKLEKYGEFDTITDLTPEDRKIIEHYYNYPGKKYMILRARRNTDFIDLPTGRGDIYLYNCGPFVLLDISMFDGRINRNNLQKGTYIRIRDTVRNLVKIGIPKYGLKDDIFYGLMVY
jgi:hypothetical protein